MPELGVTVSARTSQRAVALPSPEGGGAGDDAVRDPRPGGSCRSTFGDRLVEVGGTRLKAFVFVATLGRSRWLHVGAFPRKTQDHL